MKTYKYQGRVASGPNRGWFNLDAPGSPKVSVGWHKFEIERVHGTTIKFYVDGILSRTITDATYAPWDVATVGSIGQFGSVVGNGDVWFDGVKVEYFDSHSGHVGILSPQNGDIFSAPTFIYIEADGNDSSGGVATLDSYEFFGNGAKIGDGFNVTSSIWGFEWIDVPPGNYVLTAAATGHDGLSYTSQEVEISVLEPPLPPEDLGAARVTDRSVRLHWSPSLDESIAGYAVYVDGAKVGTTPFLGFSLHGLSPESVYSIEVRAFSHEGFYSDAGASVISVTTLAAEDAPPSVLLAAGGRHSIAQDANGRLWVWGSNDGASLGTSQPIAASILEPMLSGGLRQARALAGGEGHTLAIDRDGRVVAWGDNDLLQGGFEPAPHGGVPVWQPSQVPGLAGEFVAISASATHSLAVDHAGRVWAWGDNEKLQCGTNSSTDPQLPVEVTGTDFSDIRLVAAGTGFSIALDGNGDVWSWGQGTLLGNGGDWGEPDAAEPQKVTGLPGGASKIAAGSDHALVLLDDGSAWGWGNNSDGQLGYDTMVNWEHEQFFSPVEIQAIGEVPLTGVANLSAGRKFSVFQKTAENGGTLWTCGLNDAGQLGYPGGNQSLAKEVPGISEIVAIAAGKEHLLLANEDGEVGTWGRNTSGQLGDGTIIDRDAVAWLEDLYLSLDAGDVYFAPLPGSSTRSISLEMTSGVIGSDVHYTTDGTEPDVGSAIHDPEQPILFADSPLIRARAFNDIGGLYPGPLTAGRFHVGPILAAGGRHSLALWPDGTVETWGSSVQGLAGIDSFDEEASLFPRLWTFSPSFRAISAGSRHNLAIDGRGNLWAWGDNGEGQLGVPFTDHASSPMAVPALDGLDLRAVSAGSAHNLAIDHRGEVWAWGNNLYWQVGTDAGSTLVRFPEKVRHYSGEPLREATAISAANDFSLALLADGTVWTWGRGYFLGLGGLVSETRYPQQVALEDIVSIATGANHALALRGDGTVWGWGRNFEGQLGDFQVGIDPTSSPAISPEPMLTATGEIFGGVIDVAAGDDFSIMLMDDGTVWTTGFGSGGEEGYEGFTGNPVQVQGLVDIVFIHAGGDHAFALTSAGVPYAWGGNAWGQLGTGDTVRSMTPLERSLSVDDAVTLELIDSAIGNPSEPIFIKANAPGAIGVAMGPEVDEINNVVLSADQEPVEFQTFLSPEETLEYFLPENAASPHTIYVQFLYGNNRKSRFREVEGRLWPSVDFELPEIWPPTIDPLPEGIYPEDTITITGKRYSDDLEVRISMRGLLPEEPGVVYSGADNLSWIASFSELPEGENRFTARAVGEVDGEPAESRPVHADLYVRTDGPLISILYPREGDISNVGLVAGRTSTATVSLEVNENPAMLDGGFWWTYLPLDAGTVSVKVHAEDDDGLMSSESLSFELAPSETEVVMLSPEDGEEVQQIPFAASGTVANPAGNPVVVNGTRAEIDPAASTFTASGLNLPGRLGVIVASRMVGDLRYATAARIALSPDPDVVDLEVVELPPDEVSAGATVPVEVRLLVNGQPRSGEPVFLDVLESGATVAPADALTSGDGTVSFTITASEELERNLIRTRASGFPGETVDFGFRTVPAAAANIVLKQDDVDPAVSAGAVVGFETKVTDAYGNLTPGALVDIVASGGATVSDLNEDGAGFAGSHQGITDEGGTIGLLLQTDEVPGDNALSVALADSPVIGDAKTVTTVDGSGWPTVVQLRDAVAANDAKIADGEYHIFQTRTIDEEVATSERIVWEMADLARMEVDDRVHFSGNEEASDIPVDNLEERVSGSSATSVYVIQSVIDWNDTVGIHEQWIDFSRGVILREMSYEPGLRDLASSFEYSNFQSYPDHNGVWVSMRIESRVEDVLIVNEVTDVILNQGLSPSFFQP